MKLVDFNKLKKLMVQTTAPEDPLALAMMRKANEILASYGLDWERVLNRVVQIVPEAEQDPERGSDAERVQIEEDFAKVGYPDGSFGELMQSFREQWEERHSLSPKQRAVLAKAAANADTPRHHR